MKNDRRHYSSSSDLVLAKSDKIAFQPAPAQAYSPFSTFCMSGASTLSYGFSRRGFEFLWELVGGRHRAVCFSALSNPLRCSLFFLRPPQIYNAEEPESAEKCMQKHIDCWHPSGKRSKSDGNHATGHQIARSFAARL